MLKQRILTALILAPAVIAAIFYLPLNYFAGFLLAVMAIGAWEWGPLMGFVNSTRRTIFVVATSLLIATLWYFIPLNNIWLKEVGDDTSSFPQEAPMIKTNPSNKYIISFITPNFNVISK